MIKNTKQKNLFYSLFLLSLLFLTGCFEDYTTPNTASVRYNSEPQGAKIYQNGQYMGTTPLDLIYTIRSQQYKNKVFITDPLICIKDGYLHKEEGTRLAIEPNWEPSEKRRVQGGKTWYYNHLLF